MNYLDTIWMIPAALPLWSSFICVTSLGINHSEMTHAGRWLLRVPEPGQNGVLVCWLVV
jgi:hypothetical protein